MHRVEKDLKAGKIKCSITMVAAGNYYSPFHAYKGGTSSHSVPRPDFKSLLPIFRISTKHNLLNYECEDDLKTKNHIFPPQFDGKNIMSIKAIIFGATGMVGEGVLNQALNNSDVESVLVINRRPCNVTHTKLKEIIHSDFYNYSAIEESIIGYNACFFCLGVSSVGMNEKDYTRITYDLTIQAAEILSRLNPDMTFCYVSGVGTDSTEKGKAMWGRVKGRTENQLMKLPFKDTFMFRPGFIKPIKGLKNTYKIYKIIGPAFPLFKLLFPKYVCSLEDLGNAMIQAAKTGYPKRIVECKDIEALAGTMKV